MNMYDIWRTVHEFESAGVSGIQVEDGIIGKHVSTGAVDMSKDVMCDHIRAMCEARKDPHFVIIARTDALWLKNDLGQHRTENCVQKMSLRGKIKT